MNSRDISTLYTLAQNQDLAGFKEKLQALITDSINDRLSPCQRQFYSGLVKPTNLVRIATESGEPSSCYYDLEPEANATKLMQQITSEITRATKKRGTVQTEVILAYAAKTGTPFKAIKVTYDPSGRKLR